MNKKIGVIADTITDTKMGRDYFASKGYDVIMSPVKENSIECTRFFEAEPKERDAYIISLIKEMKAKNIKEIVFYANSICGYVDVEKLCKENDITAITPFQAYRQLGKRYEKPCVWAATVGALEGIENSLKEGNPHINVCGVYNLSVAVDIENGFKPEEVVCKNGLKELEEFAGKAGCDCILLGCTHFPYIMNELLTFAKLPVIDPADIMLEILEAKEESSFEKVKRYFETIGLGERVKLLNHSSATVEQAAKAVGCQPCQIAKTMSFLIDEQPILIVMAGDARIDNKKYKNYFQKKAKMIPSENVEQLIGQAPGGVCPFAIADNVEVYLDVSLKRFEVVYPGAGNNHSAVKLYLDELQKYSSSKDWIDVCKDWRE